VIVTDEDQRAADAPTEEIPRITDADGGGDVGGDVTVWQVEEPLGANIVDGVAHACGINPEGDEYCLGCRKAWPCPDGVRLRAQAMELLVEEPTPEEVVAQSVATSLPWQVVADQLGVPRPEVQAFIDAGTR